MPDEVGIKPKQFGSEPVLLTLKPYHLDLSSESWILASVLPLISYNLGEDLSYYISQMGMRSRSLSLRVAPRAKQHDRWESPLKKYYVLHICKAMLLVTVQEWVTLSKMFPTVITTNLLFLKGEKLQYLVKLVSSFPVPSASVISMKLLYAVKEFMT